MKAMILAAGLGTRLRPLTDASPKALVEINGRTLLEITMTRLRSFGVNEVIVNVHHFADMVVDYLKSHNNFGMRIEISREDDLLLDTGGGLKKGSWFFLEGSREATSSEGSESNTKGVIPSEPGPPASPVLAPRGGEARDRGKMSSLLNSAQSPNAFANPDEPFLLHNVDVISTIDLHRMLQFHNEHNALATLAVQSRASSRLLLFNYNLQLVGRALPGGKAGNAAVEKGIIPNEVRDPGKASAQLKRDQTLAAAPVDCHSERSEESASSSNSPLATCHSPLPLAFSGIHIISPRLLPMLTEEGVFSIIDAYLRLASQGEKILAFRADEYYWRDLGRPADLSQAAADLQQGKL
jgi:NDP-sugar pyrophosphorylase family protein